MLQNKLSQAIDNYLNDNNNNNSLNDSKANLRGNALVGNTINYLRRYERRYQSDDFDPRFVLYTRKDCKDLYTDQLVFCVKEDPRNEFMNPHHDAANLRKFYEHKNLIQFANFDRTNGGNLRKVIDVGASARLINETAITKIVALNPHCGTGDYLREAKYIGRENPANVVKMTLSQFLERNKKLAKEGDPSVVGSQQYLYNFTDSLYYTHQDLAQVASQVNYGVFACGACHVPKHEGQTDGLLKIGDHVFGYVKLLSNEARMQMKVNGNPEFYEHDVILQEALEYDSFMIRATDDNALICHVLDRFDFGATEYTRFCIIKITVEEAEKFKQSPRIAKTKAEFIPLTVDDIIVKNHAKTCEIIPQTSEDVKKGTVTKIGGDTVAFKAVKDKIVGVRVNNIVKKRENVVEVVKHFKKDIAAKFADITLGNIDSDFELPMSTYNKVVKEITKAEQINKKVLKSALFIAQINLPNADMNQYLLPVVASALRDAFGLEVRLTEMLDSKTAQLLQKVKTGEDVKASQSIFHKLAQWVLGSEDESLDF